jgi:hypothetical protein
MIQVKCPKCREVVRLDDDQAGGVGSCTECGQRFRVPTPKPASPIRPKPAAARARPEAEEPQDEDEDDVLAELDEEDGAAPARPKKRKARRPADDEDEEEEEDRPRRRRRRRVKRWSGELLPGVSMTMTAFLGLVLLWLVLAGVAFIPVDAVSGLALLALVGLGLILIVVGRIWVLIMAFRDGAQTGMTCLLFPLYTLRFVAENQEDAGPPYLVFIIGVAMIVSAVGIAYLHTGGGHP